MYPIATVLVTGAAGGLGRTVCRILDETGFQVRGLIRPEDERDGVAVTEDNLFRGYVEDFGAVSEAVRGVDAVVNCAALLPNSLHLGPAAFETVNVEGSLNVLRAAGSHDVRRAIFFSTISVVDHVTRKIGPTELKAYVEDPHDAYLASKIDAERALQKAAVTFDGQVSILRPAFIYGPENFSVWQDALKLVKQEKMIIIGDGNVHLPLIYAADIAKFLILLLSQRTERPSLEIFVLSSPETTTIRDVFHFISDYLRVRRPRHAPYLPLYVAASLVSLIPKPLRIGRVGLLTKARLLQYSRGYDLSGVINPPPLGFVPPTSYQVGLPRMLDDYEKKLAASER